MDEKQRKEIIKNTFNTVAENYDIETLRFFSECAGQLAAFLNLRGDEHVLDVASGTGHAALSIARRLDRGMVTGVDFSAGMLEKARRKAADMNISNVKFVEGDMQALDFPENFFDAAVCAFGIFFVDDMVSQLSHVARMVKPGGVVAITCFREDYFSPQKEMLLDRLAAYGVQIPPQTWKLIAGEQGSRGLFQGAGLLDVRVGTGDAGYYLKDSLEWWDVVWNAGYRRMVAQIAPERQDDFKREHLREIDGLKTGNGIRLDVGFLITAGIKP